MDARVWQRIKSASGESVVETLVSVLICTFAVLMLYTAIAAASRMNMAAEASVVELEAATYQAEVQNSTGDYRFVEISGFDEPYLVEYYSNDDGTYSSYKLREQGRTV